jgi:NUMOD4 motif/HNH endonuclease
MAEKWRPIPGFEDRYRISDRGRVMSLAFLQRYKLRNGEWSFRRTKVRYLKQQKQNCGYLLVWLWKNNKQKVATVHRLVARAFVTGNGKEVNHKNGVKTDNRASNLEWVSRSRNHLHAVDIGLNKQAVRVQHPRTRKVYPSISQAAAACRIRAATVRKTFERIL